MKHACIAIVALSLFMVGCSGSKTRETDAKEYFSNLRIHIQPVSRTAINGVLEPKFTLVLTNAGAKTIRRIKIIGDVSLGGIYHNTVVKLSKEKIKKDGGQLKVEFTFKKSDKMTDAQVLMNQMKYNFTVQEIGF